LRQDEEKRLERNGQRRKEKQRRGNEKYRKYKINHLPKQ